MKARNRILLAAIKNLIAKSDIQKATQILGRLHSVDAANVIEHLNDDEKQQIFNVWSPESSAEALLEMDEHKQVDIAEHLEPALIADILEEMPADDATDLIGDLDAEVAENILSLMKKKQASQLRQLLTFGKNTAGGLMTPEFVSLKKTKSTEAAIEKLRRVAKETETIYTLFIVNDENQLVGALSLKDLIIAPAKSLLKEIMDPEVIYIEASSDQEEAAQLMSKYDLLVLPVVDAEQYLLGIITIDDVVDVIEDEATEDMYKMSGASEFEDVTETTLITATRSRSPWIILALLGEVLVVGAVAARFTFLLKAVPALAIYWAAMTSVGGNTSFQVATVAVRGLAIGSVDPRAIRRRVSREFLLSISLSAITAATFFILARLLSSALLPIAIIVAVANVAIVITSALIGALVPIGFHRVGIDPAVSSNPLLALIMDALSLLIYFSIALVVLQAFGVI